MVAYPKFYYNQKVGWKTNWMIFLKIWLLLVVINKLFYLYLNNYIKTLYFLRIIFTLNKDLLIPISLNYFSFLFLPDKTNIILNLTISVLRFFILIYISINYM